MDYGDPDARPLLDLEGLKQWVPGRASGYGPLEAAVDDVGSTTRGRSPPTAIDPEGLGAVRRWTSAARARPRRPPAGRARAGGLPPGGAPAGRRRAVRTWRVHLGAWARRHGHRRRTATSSSVATPATERRWRRAERAGAPDRRRRSRRRPRWGLAARGRAGRGGRPATVGVDLDGEGEVWADIAPRLYAQARPASGTRRRPSTGLRPRAAPDEVEAAVVQVMTYLVENEQAALRRAGPLPRPDPPALPRGRAAPRRPGGRRGPPRRGLHPPGRAARAAARASRRSGGRASLQTLLDEPDFALAAFLLSVLGEGTFLNLLAFLEHHAPDPVTAPRRPPRPARTRPATSPSAWATWASTSTATPQLRPALAAAVRRRHDALAGTAGLADEVQDALVVLAAGEWSQEAIGRRLGPGHLPSRGDGRGAPSAPVTARLLQCRSHRTVCPAYPQLHVKARRGAASRDAPMMPTEGQSPAPAVEECWAWGRAARGPRSGGTGVMRRVGPFHVVPLLVLVLLLVVTAAATVAHRCGREKPGTQAAGRAGQRSEPRPDHLDQHHIDRPPGPHS